MSGGRFGESVALEGDTLVAGAIEESAGATRAGAAYVFVRGAMGWSSGVQLRSSMPQTQGWFGARVTLRDGVLVVGATGEDFASGAAHVFGAGAGGAFEHEAMLTASDSGPADFMGEAVAVSGDTIVVGAPGASFAANSAGSVYVFTRANGEWSRQSRLTASNPVIDGAFGVRVALRGDLLIATASQEGSGASGINASSGAVLERSGAAYLFERRDGAWSQVAYIKAERPGASDLFGSSVALLGDAVILGAEGEASTARGVDGDADDDAAPASGAVYVVR
jgi:trimeric autotransporter adhesin